MSNNCHCIDTLLEIQWRSDIIMSKEGLLPWLEGSLGSDQEAFAKALRATALTSHGAAIQDMFPRAPAPVWRALLQPPRAQVLAFIPLLMDGLSREPRSQQAGLYFHAR